MSPSTRKKLLIGGGGFIGLLIVALLITPLFFDLNKYKPEIAAQAKKATGRDLAIDGPINLSLLPWPSITVAGVKLANMAGAKSPQMLEVKSVTVKPSLLALIGGNVEISSMTLVEPKIAVEVNAQGKASWDFTPAAEGKPAEAKTGSPAPQSFSLGRLDIEDGTIGFSDAACAAAAFLAMSASDSF